VDRDRISVVWSSASKSVRGQGDRGPIAGNERHPTDRQGIDIDARGGEQAIDLPDGMPGVQQILTARRGPP
jgi:hypothetical protein